MSEPDDERTEPSIAAAVLDRIPDETAVGVRVHVSGLRSLLGCVLIVGAAIHQGWEVIRAFLLDLLEGK